MGKYYFCGKPRLHSRIYTTAFYAQPLYRRTCRRGKACACLGFMKTNINTKPEIDHALFSMLLIENKT